MAGHVPRAMAFDTNAVGVEAADTSMVAWMPADRQKAFNTEEERRTSRVTEEATMRCARGRTVSPHRPPEGRRHRLTAQACCHYAFIVSRDRKCDRGTVLASKQCSAPIQRILAISWKKGNAHALLYSVRHRPVVRGWMCPPANHNDLCEAGDNDDHLYAGGQNDCCQRTTVVTGP
jgi:hypothetical protein